MNVLASEQAAKELQQYDDVMKYILVYGKDRGDRTNTGTRSIFAYPKALEFNVGERFPAVYKKTLVWNPMISELLWFLSGSTNLFDLKEIQFDDRNSNKKTVWDANYENEGKALGYTDGEMGPIYGEHMGRQWLECLKLIKDNPEDRRIVMSNWQFDHLGKMTLPPCHGLHTQFYVDGDTLHLSTTMRSTDVFLGLPFNIASYATMLCITAKLCGLKPGKLSMYLMGDVHLYHNHMDQVEEYLSRLDYTHSNTKLVLPEDLSLEDITERKLTCRDIFMVDYISQGVIKAPMAFKKN